MLLPFAFAFIIVFIIVALWMVIRQTKGKTEKRNKVDGPQGPHI